MIITEELLKKKYYDYYDPTYIKTAEQWINDYIDDYDIYMEGRDPRQVFLKNVESGALVETD